MNAANNQPFPPMTTTAKTLLQTRVFPALDELYAKVPSFDREEVTKEVRQYIARVKSAGRASPHDTHTNNATTA
jgi:hypothetical protein